METDAGLNWNTTEDELNEKQLSDNGFNDLDYWKKEATNYHELCEKYEERLLDLKTKLKEKDKVIEKLENRIKCLEKPGTVEPSKTTWNSSVSEHKITQEDPLFCKIFIGHLGWSMTEADLESYFSKYGNITHCQVIRDSKTESSRGFGFVTFEDSAAVDEVQKCRPHTINGRQVDTKRAMPSDTLVKTDVSKSEAGGRRIFVGGLKNLSQQELESFFSQFGEVETIQTMMNAETGNSRGFGYINFHDSDTVDKILVRRYHTVNGTNVEVKRAQSVNQIKGGKTLPLGPTNPIIPPRFFQPGFSPNPRAPNVPWPRSEPPNLPVYRTDRTPWVGPEPQGQAPGSGVDLMQLASLITNFAQQQNTGYPSQTPADGFWPADAHANKMKGDLSQRFTTPYERN